MEYVNVLTSTGSELQDVLSQNKTNSVELVKLYLNQIEALVQPSTRAALYGLKCTLGTTDLTGIQAGAKAFSSLGGMAKSVKERAQLLKLIQGTDYSSFLTNSWEVIRIGVVDPDPWQPADFVVELNEKYRAGTYEALEGVINKIRDNGGDVQQPVQLVSLAYLTSDPRGVLETEELMGESKVHREASALLLTQE